MAAKRLLEVVARLSLPLPAMLATAQVASIASAIDMDDVADSVRAPETPAQEPFPVVVKGRYGFINRHGELVVAPRFAKAESFYDSLAVARENTALVVLDRSGKTVATLDAEEARPFSDGLAAVRRGRLWGYVDKHGTVVVPPSYLAAHEFQEGLAPVRSKDGWGFIGIDGKTVISAQFAEVGPFSEGLARVRTAPQQWRYIDRTGATRIQGPFLSAAEFHDGLACVEQGTSVGFIDRQGKMATTLGEDIAFGCLPGRSFFVDGLALVALRRYGTGMPAFVDKTGRVVVKHPTPASRLAAPFSDGRALFFEETAGKTRFGFVDSLGKVAIPATFDNAETFRSGLSRVEVDGQVGYIDIRGTFLWKPSR